MTRPYRSALRLALCAAVSATALAGCANTTGQARLSRDAVLDAQAAVEAPQGLDPLAEAAFWGARHDADPTDSASAIQFARALRRIGSFSEAVSVLERLERADQLNAELRGELGKSLTADGRAFEGVRHLQYAAGQTADDWRVFSAYGVALDQIGEHADARVQYDRALALAPAHTTVLNNKALSYALSGKLETAEEILRDVAGRPASPAKVRQNLALILGLKGEFRDAERLARADLPPTVADNNVEYFRSMLSQPAYWRDLQTLDSANAAQALPRAAAFPAPTADGAPTQTFASELIRTEKVSAQPLDPIEN